MNRASGRKKKTPVIPRAEESSLKEKVKKAKVRALKPKKMKVDVPKVNKAKSRIRCVRNTNALTSVPPAVFNTAENSQDILTVHASQTIDLSPNDNWCEESRSLTTPEQTLENEQSHVQLVRNENDVEHVVNHMEGKSESNLTMLEAMDQHYFENDSTSASPIGGQEQPQSKIVEKFKNAEKAMAFLMDTDSVVVDMEEDLDFRDESPETSKDNMEGDLFDNEMDTESNFVESHGNVIVPERSGDKEDFLEGAEENKTDAPADKTADEESTLSHSHRRKKLSKLVTDATKKLAAKWGKNKKRGQHKFVPHSTVLPKFSDNLLQILNFGSKIEIAEKYNEIAREISIQMHADDGAGNTVYFRQLRKELILEFPGLDNALLRNKYRRYLTPRIDNADLSEDESEIPALRPDTQDERRTFTKPGKNLYLLTQAVGRMNRNARKFNAREEVVDKAIECLELHGFTKLGNKRWERVNMAFSIDDQSKVHLNKVKHQHCVDSNPLIDFPEGYRQTFGYRTKAIKLTSATLADILNVYPLLKFKEFVEAECFLGSEEKYFQYLANVQLAWKGIGKLDETMDAEGNFQDMLSVLGPLSVLFREEEHLVPKADYPWPYVVHTPRQTHLRYQGHDFYDINSLKDALAHLILLINMFYMPTKCRPQLLLLLESLFFGYQAPALSKANIIFMNKIIELAQETE